jgi:hypothetical protein
MIQPASHMVLLLRAQHRILPAFVEIASLQRHWASREIQSVSLVLEHLSSVENLFQ